MRFRAKLANKHVQLLYSLIGHISRLRSLAVLHLCRSNVRISSRDGDGICCFVELKAGDGIFLEHRIESLADNTIVFEIDLIQWKTVLQSVLSGNGEETRQKKKYDDDHDNNNGSHYGLMGALESSTTTMKLAKRNGGIPCLCLDASSAGGPVEIHHAIPVRIMRVADIQYHLPPVINLPDVQLELPLDNLLRTVVERLKVISPHVYVEASMRGELTLRIDSDGASIRTFFTKLIPRFDDCNNQNDPDGECTIKVDTKKLSNCMQWQATMAKNISSAMICLVENEMLVVHVFVNPASVGFFTYYVPVHFLSNPHTD